MNHRICIALLASALISFTALAEPTDAEYLVDMTSEQVVQLEQRLSELGYFNGESDATYDAETRSALESFQQANGLEVTGAADGATLERLNSSDALTRQDYLTRFANAYAQMETLKKGDVSNDVLVMQRRLKEYGYFSGNPGGAFDDATRQAVEGFQMVNGLPVTGVADGATLMRLMADSPISWPAFLAEMSAGEGDTGLNVYALQNRLAQLGYFTGSCTATFGELTRNAVTRFQEDAGIEATGQADAATWAALYSRSDAAARSDGLHLGDSGDDVLEIQNRLNALGFFDHEVSGEYGYTTQTAVRLFQLATDLEATGELDERTRERLMADPAASMMDVIVQRRFTMMIDSADNATQARIAEIARELIGASFGPTDDELYPGFPFVQYVCVAAGLPITFPEDLIRLASRQVESISAVEPGDIVAFESSSADTVSMLLAIGAGDGQVICTTESGGWAELSYMDRMEGTTIYCWDAQ